MNSGMKSGISGPDNGPKALVYSTTAVSLTTATLTNIPMQQIDYDNFGVTSLIGVDGDLLIPKDGWYDIKAQGGFAANGTGVRVSEIFVTYPDGGTGQLADSSGPGTAAAITGVSVNANVYLRRGSKVRLKQYQNSGGALNTAGGFISYAWIGP